MKAALGTLIGILLSPIVKVWVWFKTTQYKDKNAK